MNNVNLSEPEKIAIAQDSIILKFSLLGCVGLALIGLGVFTFSSYQNGVKSQLQATGKPNKMQTLTKPSDPPPVIVKKPNKPIVIEEGSEAYFCLKNNGGSGCLNRDRFAPNYRVIDPPKTEKTYEDYLVQYGVRGDGYCGRYLNGEPNC